MKSTFIIAIFMINCQASFAGEFDSQQAGVLIKSMKEYKTPQTGHFKGIVVDNRQGLSKLAPKEFAEEEGKTRISLSKVELTFDKNDFRSDLINYETRVDNEKVQWQENSKKTAILRKDKVMEYSKFGERTQDGYIRPPGPQMQGRPLFYPYSHDSMLRHAGYINYQYTSDMYKDHYVADTDDGPMDVIILQNQKYKSYVNEIGIYRNNGRLGLYKLYKDGCLAEMYAFSGYKVTNSGDLYPTKLTYKAVDSVLPGEIKDRIKKNELYLWSREVLKASKITWEHSWDWEIEKAEIRQRISPSVFDFKFPPGTTVIDSTGPQDLKYTVPDSDIPVEALDTKGSPHESNNGEGMQARGHNVAGISTTTGKTPESLESDIDKAQSNDGSNKGMVRRNKLFIVIPVLLGFIFVLAVVLLRSNRLKGS
jgi:hypothetical protein